MVALNEALSPQALGISKCICASLAPDPNECRKALRPKLPKPHTSTDNINSSEPGSRSLKLLMQPEGSGLRITWTLKVCRLIQRPS